MSRGESLNGAVEHRENGEPEVLGAICDAAEFVASYLRRQVDSKGYVYVAGGVNEVSLSQGLKRQVIVFSTFPEAPKSLSTLTVVRAEDIWSALFGSYGSLQERTGGRLVAMGAGSGGHVSLYARPLTNLIANNK